VQDVDAGMLDAGKLVATVPPAAIGFRVLTPATIITDLGTQFGVDVNDRGSVNLHVITGRVSSVPRVGQLRETVELIAGQSLRFDGRWHRFATPPADRQSFQALARTIDIQVIRSVMIHDVSSELSDAPFDRRAEHLIDNSGVTSGGHSPHPDAPSYGAKVGNMWLTRGTYMEPHDPLPAHVTFDLGGVFELTGIHVWNYNEAALALYRRGAKHVRISVSPSLDPDEFVELSTIDGGFAFPMADGTAAYRGFLVDLDTVLDPAPLQRVRMIRFEILANHALELNDACTGLSEVRFFGRTAETPVVIEPPKPERPGALSP